MRILGIETSCDETAAAVVEDGIKVLSSVVASSVDIQAKYGGVVPEQAAREQVKAIMPVINEALIQAFPDSGRDPSTTLGMTGLIDAIAVTVGPGLIGSLLIGVEAAKTLAYTTGKPLIPVNHLIGHVYGAWLTECQMSNAKCQNETIKLPQFPALILLVSGGHTELVLMKGHGDFEWISGTRDDAAGECFDKVARILGLPYPGGPAIAAAAERYVATSDTFVASLLSAGKRQATRVKLPRPMMGSGTYDFSFSGLKTAVLYESRKTGINEETQKYLAYEAQEAITDVLVSKTINAAADLEVSTLIVCGGVAANKTLREKITLEAGKNGLELHIPEFKYCTDNAAYIAAAAYFNHHPVSWKEIQADSGMTIGL